MTAIINHILLDQNNGELLCSMTYIHNNGDVFLDYTRLSAKAIRVDCSYEDVVLMHEHLNSEDLAKLIQAIFGDEND